MIKIDLVGYQKDLSEYVLDGKSTERVCLFMSDISELPQPDKTSHSEYEP
jgi:hypothetical protein